MRLEPADLDALQPIIAQTVRAVLAEIDEAHAKIGNGRLAYSESEAAGLLGLARHQLRDCRLRGEIRHTRIAGRVFYTTTQITEFLTNQSS